MKYLWCMLVLVSLASCEKSINIQPQFQKPLLVVDGEIENGKIPHIVLSTSLNYFSEINVEKLIASIVTGAKITITDGTAVIPLKEFKQPLFADYYLTYYSTDSTGNNAVIGEVGKTYTLNIEYNNQQFTSVTSIPRVAKVVDSLWWKPAPRDTGTAKVVVSGRLTDPKGYGNYIRYFTRVDSGPFLPGARSVYDDQLTDGTTYDYEMDQGIDRNNLPGQDDYGFFERGDTVTAKLANIDKAAFDFWRTLEFSYESVGNPFSNPVKVLSNVSNGALGVFCGYGVQYKTLIIPK